MLIIFINNIIKWWALRMLVQPLGPGPHRWHFDDRLVLGVLYGSRVMVLNSYWSIERLCIHGHLMLLIAEVWLQELYGSLESRLVLVWVLRAFLDFKLLLFLLLLDLLSRDIMLLWDYALSRGSRYLGDCTLLCKDNMLPGRLRRHLVIDPLLRPIYDL